MNWLSEFRSGFFALWTEQGFPPPGAFQSEYEAAREAIPCPESIARLAAPATRALEPELLTSVYRFGFLFGLLCGELFGLSEDTLRHRASWCGRFNLGISLFDYICDEEGGAASARYLEPFLVFAAAPRTGPPTGANTPVQSALCQVAESVLQEFAVEVGRPTAKRLHTGAWGWLERMFLAQLGVVDADGYRNGDLARLEKALRLKSAEPFSMMAYWMARGLPKPSRAPVLWQARRLGSCLGECYWLFDDAQDLWDDLSQGRWNWWLLQVERQASGLLQNRSHPAIGIHVLRELERQHLPHRLSRRCVMRLAAAVSRLAAAEETRRRSLGLAAVSLARWAS